VQRRLPVFGVCLGLQGIIEYFGGSLAVLDIPVHGKSSLVRVRGGRLLGGLPSEFTVGRYHSLHARRGTFPSELAVTAETADGVVMAVEHVSLPIAAVQFHPESVMTLRDEIGMPIIASVIDWSAGVPPANGPETRGPRADRVRTVCRAPHGGS
jgi:anthranilate synthase